MKKKGIVFGFLFLLIFLFVAPIKSEAAWKVQNGKYYYYNSKGVLYKNRRVGKYYVGKDGARIQNKWRGNYFYGENGRRISGFNGGWETIGGRKYYYTSKGKKVTGWLKYRGKRYYFNPTGVLQVGWQRIDDNYYFFSKKRSTYGAMLKGWQTISKKRYYFGKNTGKLQQGWFKLGKYKYYSMLNTGVFTGIQNIGSASYLFNSRGIMQTGWKTYNGNKYYCAYSTGVMAKGLGTISGKIYYFNEYGIMQKSTVVTVNGQQYSVNASGICTKISTTPGTPEDMLFFTLYESGIEGYGQVGGDSGNACGKYQFDRRYSLIPLVQYCYAKDPVVFAAFAPYAKWTNTPKYQEKMKSNQKFYQAWTSIYNAFPIVFKNYQDSFAKQEYYTPTENQLKSIGIDITNRPYVLKGAIFSYSIQHGSYTAALAVRDAKITNATSNEDFIKKLYNYRIKKYSYYRSRYTTEMNDALSRL